MKAAAPALLALGVALFFAAGSFHLYGAALPLYLAGLGFDPPLIGLIVGAGALAQVPGALVAGPAIDRLGGRRVLLTGAGCYLLASLGFLWLTTAPAIAALRALQGLGIAAVVPAGYAFVPGLVAPRRRAIAFASLGAGSNLALAVCPPLGLALLEGPGPGVLFATGAALALAGLGTAGLVPAPDVPSSRPLRLMFRRVWAPPLAVALLTVVQFGAVMTFVPLEARPQGANPALLFTADALGVLVGRIPAGWAADRYGSLPLTLGGIVCMTAAVLLLLLPLTDGLLIASGALNGLGGALVLPPILAELSRRSDDADRGSALAYFAGTFGLGLLLGSGGGGLLYPHTGFDGLLVVGAALCASAVAVALKDPLARRPALPPSVPGP